MVSVRFTFDTNILLYALVRQDNDKRRVARDLIRRARAADCVITLQTLGELFRVLTGKLRRPAPEAAAAVAEWRAAVPVVAANEACLIDAMDAVAGHGLSFWDAMQWATAKHAGCDLVLTEDGQDGFVLGGVTLVNPFASPRAPLLVQALRAQR
jgi:predicted nucleic acid-binding protein